jgi:hypothetical protein
VVNIHTSAETQEAALSKVWAQVLNQQPGTCDHEKSVTAILSVDQNWASNNWAAHEMKTISSIG